MVSLDAGEGVGNLENEYDADILVGTKLPGD